jgi:hypothetical protein
MSASPEAAIPERKRKDENQQRRLDDLILIVPQNSFGRGRSCLAFQVMTVAVAIMMAIPTILRAT